jgi:hypothetical protein
MSLIKNRSINAPKGEMKKEKGERKKEKGE